MLTGIGPELLVPGGLGGGLLALTVFLILRGYLVPRRSVEDVKSDRDYWRTAAQEAIAQNRELMETARTMRDVLNALPRPPAKEASPK